MKYNQREESDSLGYCWRAKDEIVNEVLLWQSTQGRSSWGQFGEGD